MSSTPSPWTSLLSRRFGGDAYERIVTLHVDDVSGEPVVVRVESSALGGHFHVEVRTSTSNTVFSSVSTRLSSPTSLPTTLNTKTSETTIVSQPPPAAVPASSSPNTMERLHVFNGGAKTSFIFPSPKWLLSLGGEILNAAKGALKAPMPSLVVEVRVKVGDRVDKGQAVVVLESMKTETVLRAEAAGVVKAVGCGSGEMVEESRELVDIEEDVASGAE